MPFFTKNSATSWDSYSFINEAWWRKTPATWTKVKVAAKKPLLKCKKMANARLEKPLPLSSMIFRQPLATFRDCFGPDVVCRGYTFESLQTSSSPSANRTKVMKRAWCNDYYLRFARNILYEFGKGDINKAKKWMDKEPWVWPY